MPEPRDWLRLAAERRVRLLGICTGTFALAQAGVKGAHGLRALERAGSFSRALSADPRRGGPAVHRRGRLDFLRGVDRRDRPGPVPGGAPLRPRQGATGHAPHDAAGRAAGARAAGAFPQRSPASRICASGRPRISSSSASTIRRRWTPSPVMRRRRAQVAGTGVPPGHGFIADGFPAPVTPGIWLLAAAEQAQQHYPGCAGLRFRRRRAFRATSARILAYPRVNICNPGRPSRANLIPLAVWRQSESIGFCLACMPVARRHIRGAPVITLGN